MRHFCIIRIKTKDKNKVLLKLNKINVNIRNINYQDKYLYLEILYDDITRIKKYLLSEKIEIIDEAGLYKVKKKLKENTLFIISIIFSIIIFLILSNIIVKVNVIHSDTSLREILYDALKARGVDKLTLKKSYDEYEKIIKDIKDTYKDKIEWLEIDVDGMVINVRVEERIENNLEKNTDTCHIVASKSGIIENIKTLKGVAEVKIHDHVKEGDILINGMVKLNDEVKMNVCAEGEVYAEVWYTVKASIPLEYDSVKRTKKMRYNFMVKTPLEEYQILKSRVGNAKEIEKQKIFKMFNYEFYLEREYEVEVTPKKYSEEEALAVLEKQIEDKFKIKGSKISDIISKKYLKKNINNGNLDIEMFVAVKEQIGVVKHYNVEIGGASDKEYWENNNNIN